VRVQGLTVVVMGVLLVGTVPASGQEKKAGAAPKKSAAKQPDPDAQQAAKERRETAILMLMTLADDAGKFSDLGLRARVQARAADALWETDRERSRALFQRAWESADVAQDEAERKAEDERRRRKDSGEPMVFYNQRDLRMDVLEIVAQRDRKLSDEFLARYTEAKAREASAAASPATAVGDFPSLAGPLAARLDLATSLLDKKDLTIAIGIAEPALATVTVNSIEFLTKLREKDAPSADRLFAAMLARATADPASDSTTVSLLSSYVLSPHTYVLNGTIQSWGGATPPPALGPELRDAFFETAASIMLRPITPEELDKVENARITAYFVITRLLPSFDQNAPHLAERLRVRQTALATDELQSRMEKNRSLTAGFAQESDEHTDTLQEALDQARKAATAPDRDRAYVSAALAATQKGDPKSREYADAIEEADLRRRVRGVVDIRLVMYALNPENNAAKTIQLARSGEITNIQRVWALSRAAVTLAKSEPTQAIEVLDEASTVAKRIDPESPDRASAHFAIASAFATVAPTRVVEAANDAVRAAAKVPTYQGTGGHLEIQLSTPGGVWMWIEAAEEFDVTRPFEALAQDDLTAASLLAKTLAGDSARAFATLTVAKTVLSRPPRSEKVTAKSDK
jgi:hypothetical protein